jgi:Xaa-Pro dipeptidase
MNQAVTAADRALRAGRLRDLADRHKAGAVLLRRHQNFAWYTCGADSRVERASPLGVADIVVTAEAEYVVTSTIEAERMRREQTPDIEVAEYPWYEDPAPLLSELAGGAPLLADTSVEGALDVQAEVARLRRILDPDALAQLRDVGADAAEALADAAQVVRPGVGELEVAAEISAACRRRGLDATVLLAAADERIALYRHPIPAGATIERRAMLVISAERGGLYANLTRFVELEEPDPELTRRKEACAELLRRMREEATRPGRTLAEAFEDCRRFYAKAGFPDEWRRHHQGGMTGYASREVIATPYTGDEIAPGQAFAWNPSITGAKAEETFVLTASGPEIVTGAARESRSRYAPSPRAGA